MTRSRTMLVLQDGNLVFTKRKRHLEDEFVVVDADSSTTGFLIPDNEFFYEEELTIDNYVEKHQQLHGISRPDPLKLSLSSPTNNKLTLQRDSVKRLTALGTQQKYALLARAAYFEGDEKQINALFGKVGVLRNFTLDKELSTKKNSVFVDSNTGEVVIAYKGTNPTNKEDLYDDLQIVLSREDSTSRFQKANDLYTKVEAKYGKENVRIAGHSLGGAIAMYVGERNDVESHSFNPAISALRAMRTHGSNTKTSYVYRTKGDPVSVGAHLNADSNRRVIQVEQKDVLDTHSIDNFYKTKRGATFEDVNNKMNNMMMTMFRATVETVVKEEFGEELDLMNSTKPMSDEEAKAIGLDKVADMLKSSKRRDEDKLMELAESQKKSESIQVDIDGDIVSKGGVRYVQVMGGGGN